MNPNFSFADYVAHTQEHIIATRRSREGEQKSEFAIEANSPFEILPAENNDLSTGLLMVHGLFDSPYTFRELASALACDGVHCRTVLLPGHGTQPADLLEVRYQQWQEAVEFGIRSFGTSAKRIFLLGFSLGTLLCLRAVIKHRVIAGIILLAPSFGLHSKTEWLLAEYLRFQRFLSWKQWVKQLPEINQVRYLSITVNSVLQFDAVRKRFFSEWKNEQDVPPLLMILSEEDETVDSQCALQWFQQLTGDCHRLLMYSRVPRFYNDTRITNKSGRFPHLQIDHLSHCCWGFSPQNVYYGVEGTYTLASRLGQPQVTYGAYNRFFAQFSRLKLQWHTGAQYYQELTYNPEFAYMLQQISDFLRQPNPATSAKSS